MAKVKIEDGEHPATDPSGPATQLVRNWTIDGVGANHLRPGLVDLGVTGLTAYPVIGLYPWGRWLIVVTEDRLLWAIHDSTPTIAVAISDPADVTTHLDGNRRPTFAADGMRVVIAGGAQIQQWQGAGLSSRLVPAGGPAASHVVYVGNRFVANDLGTPQTFAWSDIGDGSHGTWGALSYSVADAAPDPVLGVFTANRELWVMGSETVQVYGIGTDPLNPFEMVNTLWFGSGAAYSPVAIGGMMAWLDQRGQIVISNGHATIQALEPTVTSHDITEIIRSFGVTGDCWAYRRDQGHDSHAIFVFPTAGRSFVWDWKDQQWTEESFFAAGVPGPMPIYSFAHWSGLNICGGTGALYQYDPAAATDLGGALVAERITGWTDFGTPHWKRSAHITVTVRRGAWGSGKLELRVRDDGEPWGDWEEIEVASGELDPSAVVYVGGVFKRRQYHLRYSGPDDMAIVGLDDEVEDLEAQQQ